MYTTMHVSPEQVFHTCLMAMDTLIELMDPSISTLSFSLRLTTTGVRSSSLLLLRRENGGEEEEGKRGMSERNRWRGRKERGREQEKEIFKKERRPWL